VPKNILVTGGAGFIGSFLVDKLVERGHRVRILDNLDPQVHPGGAPPAYLNRGAEFVRGDVRARDLFLKSLKNVQVVFHMASCVGVGQSQYEVEKYTSVNCGGTALLWALIAKEKLSVEKVILPGSMTCFGEGLSVCPDCGTVKPRIRQEDEIRDEDFSCRCPACGKAVSPVATPSLCKMEPGSVYALTKKYQEDLSLNLGRLYRIPAVVLRYFNVYGPRQSLSNPYTGVSAIFISRIKNGKNPVVYEDGLQTRDFISVHDVADANIRVMESTVLDDQAMNLGSGEPLAIGALGERLIRLLRSDTAVDITSKFRKGDIRHCYADKAEVREKLGFEPQINLDRGMLELAQWSEDQAAEDKFDTAASELKDKGIL
jgi:dTDP-L-rhamnose 4-epimerase